MGKKASEQTLKTKFDLQISKSIKRFFYQNQEKNEIPINSFNWHFSNQLLNQNCWIQYDSQNPESFNIKKVMLIEY